jgi:hypothetical protein
MPKRVVTDPRNEADGPWIDSPCPNLREDDEESVSGNNFLDESGDGGIVPLAIASFETRDD